MSWQHYTRLLTSSDQLPPKEWLRELHAAIAQRRAFAGLSTPPFDEYVPQSDYWQLLNAAAPVYIDPATRQTIAPSTYVAAQLGYSPILDHPLPTRDLYNACRLACELFVERRFTGVGNAQTRRGSAAGVTTGAVNGYDEGTPWPSSSYGQSTFSGSLTVAQNRLAADGTAPEQNPQDIGTSGKPYATIAYSSFFDLPNYQDPGDYFNWAGLFLQDRPLTYTIPAALLTAAGGTLPLSGQFRLQDTTTLTGIGGDPDEHDEVYYFNQAAASWEVPGPFGFSWGFERLPGTLTPGYQITQPGGTTNGNFIGLGSSYTTQNLAVASSSPILDLVLSGDEPPPTVPNPISTGFFKVREQTLELESGHLFANVQPYLDHPPGQLTP